jgi:hypothetical protein
MNEPSQDESNAPIKDVEMAEGIALEASSAIPAAEVTHS